MSKITPPDDRLLISMRKGINRINYNKYTYRLLGRGGEGNVYEYHGHAIKVYRVDNRYDPELVYHEIYVTDVLHDVGIQVVTIKEFDPIKAYAFSELYDNDLDYWAKTACQRDSAATEEQWMSMIFQVAHAFTMTNDLGVLHNDPKPKNIFYARSDNTVDYEYNKKKYSVNHNGYRFVLGDFSRSLIVGYDEYKHLPGSSSTGDLYGDLRNKTDLYELSRLLYRVIVNATIKHYSSSEIRNRVSHIKDAEFQARIKNVTTEIKNGMPAKLIDRTIDRAYAYELVESDYLDYDSLSSRATDLVLPSEKVRKTLESVQRMTIDELFENIN